MVKDNILYVSVSRDSGKTSYESITEKGEPEGNSDISVPYTAPFCFQSNNQYHLVLNYAGQY